MVVFIHFRKEKWYTNFGRIWAYTRVYIGTPGTGIFITCHLYKAKIKWTNNISLLILLVDLKKYG